MSQIQNYVKYRRQKNGDINNLEGVLDYIKNKTIESMDDVMINSLLSDDLIYFGAEVEDGSDEHHFHLGLTSKRLLETINGEQIIFEIDFT